jgi:malonyl CoA-acyl carrier protein transacylase/NAD(P)-dependent dehydrogenase (short-subunit alcohol dehydrogenase family)/SAM-dependent methyltransferase/acyl carrier protein
MGRELLEQGGVFAETVERCEDLLKGYVGWSVVEEMKAEESRSRLEETEVAQPAIFAMQMGLTALWRSWGVEPDAVVGHSVGEVAAATVAGVLSLEEAVKVIFHRGRVMQQATGLGRMVEVEVSEGEVQSWLRGREERISVAAANTAQSVVLSGDREALGEVVEALERAGVHCQEVPVNYAFHSSQMEPYRAEVIASLEGLRTGRATIPIISTVTGESTKECCFDGEYWWRNIRQSVRFAAAMDALLESGISLFVEVGPHPVLSGSMTECLEHREREGTVLPSLRRGRDGRATQLSSLGALYVKGFQLDWRRVHRNCGRCLLLPTYPFQRKPYWIEPSKERVRRMSTLSQVEATPPTNQESAQDWLYEIAWRPRSHLNSGSPADYLLAPAAIGELLVPRLPQLLMEFGLRDYAEILNELEALSAGYVLWAFRTAKEELSEHHRFSITSLASRLGVVHQHLPLLGRLLEILAEESVLRRVGDEWEVVREPEIRNPQEWSSALMSKYPVATAELTILQLCGSHLSDVLRGELDPVRLLFPDGDVSMATRLYQDSPGSRVMNTLVREAMTAAVQRLPEGRSLRILEIGAGTGGTTSAVLPHLPTDRTKYLFTDLSPLFTAKARQRFTEYTFVQYRSLDIEQAPGPQGFGSDKYDIVLAANVLHATRELSETLEHVRELLAPQGMLLLLEGTRRQRWIDLIFGLTDGWWRFADRDLRPSHPLLSACQWQALLQQSGFETALTIPPVEEETQHSFPQAVIIAQSGEDRAKEAGRDHGHWLILADHQGTGESLAGILRSRGETCSLAFAGEQYEQVAEDVFRISPLSAADFRCLVERVREANRAPLRGILHLWSLDALDAETLRADDMRSASERGCGSVLQVVQGLARAGLSQRPRLVLVTRGAQPVGSQPKVPGVAQSPLWGMGRVIALEQPELKCALVDLDPDASGNSAEALFKEIWWETMEGEVAFRHGGRYVPRLIPRVEPVVQDCIRLSAEGTYVITGGLGAMGLLVARWLVQLGARYLVLVGRSAATETARGRLQELEQLGARVLVKAADVVHEEQVVQVLADIEQSLPPLRGVIHSVGVLDDGLLREQTWERFARVMEPKVEGAWNLHNLTRHIPLDFFIMFSSGVSLLGSPGGGNYGAANSFLDAFAHQLRARGVPALSINWGPWAEVGMALNPKLHSAWHSRGLETVSAERNLEVLGTLLRQQAVQVAALSVNWPKFFAHLVNETTPPLLRDLAAVHPAIRSDRQDREAQTPARMLLAQIAAATLPLQPGLLSVYLRQRFAAVLNISEEEVPIDGNIFELGLDSLMSMEVLKRISEDFKIIVYPREFAERPTVAAFAEYLVHELRRPQDAVAVMPPGETPKVGSRVPLVAMASSAETAPAPGKRVAGAAFVLSSPRSGSTLLRVMLAGHPMLFAPPELNLLPFNTMVERQEQLRLSHMGEGLERALMELKGISAEESRALVAELTGSNVSIDDVYRILTELAGGRMLVDKSPGYAVSVATLRRAETWFDRPKYIFLVRHPYAVIESFVRMRMEKLIGGDGHTPHKFAEQVWTQTNGNILKFLESTEADRQHLVYYEALVSDPETVMRKVCDFLEIPFDPVVLRPYEGKRMTDGLHAQSLPLSDPNFLSHATIEAKLGEVWRSIHLPRRLDESARSVASRLEYELPNETDAPVQVSASSSAPVSESPRELFVSIRGIRQCVSFWGPDHGRTVVCLHGILEHGVAWEAVATSLVQEGYRVVAPDLRGHGRSGHVPKGACYYALDFLGDIDALVRQLMNQPFVLVGHSLGAALAAMFAAVRPEWVSALVLVEPLVPSATADFGAAQRLTTHLNYIASEVKHSVFSDVNAAAKLLRRQTPSMSEAMASRMAHRITEPCDGGVRWQWDPILRTRTGIGLDSALGRTSYLEMLGRIKLPITLMFGKNSSHNRPDDVTQLLGAAEGASRVELPGGHNLHIDAPAELARNIAMAAALALGGQ